MALAGLPLGLAFFAWDVGVKRGDIQVLGAASYLAPLLSTLILILFGLGRFDVSVGFAAAAIAIGAAIASLDMLRRRSPASPQA